MKNRARAGFTLVELMIALVAGAFAVSGVYYLNGVSSRAFSEQMRVSETQMSLRSAMEQLRRDIVRAGYLGTPTTAQARGCDGLPGGVGVTDQVTPIQAINVSYDASNADDTAVAELLAAPATNPTRADRVDLWGNYATADAYLVDPTQTTSTTITLQTNSEAFRRSFFDPQPANAPAVWNDASFREVFAAGRMVRIEHNGRFFFREIAAPNTAVAGAPSITLTNALPFCFVENGWSAVSPLVHHRYQLEADSQADLGRLRMPARAGVTALPGARRTMLVRREIRKDAAVAFSSHLLLDYAVEFSVDAVINSAAAGLPPTWAFVSNGAMTTQSANNPEQFRSLLVTLTARSPEADPKLPAMARTTFNTAGTFNSPLGTFRVIDPANPTVVLNARVRTLRSEIFLQNL